MCRRVYVVAGGMFMHAHMCVDMCMGLLKECSCVQTCVYTCVRGCWRNVQMHVTRHMCPQKHPKNWSKNDGADLFFGGGASCQCAKAEGLRWILRAVSVLTRRIFCFWGSSTSVQALGVRYRAERTKKKIEKDPSSASLGAFRAAVDIRRRHTPR